MNSFRFLERGIEAELERQARDPRRRAARSSRRRCTSTRATARSRRCARRSTRTTTATSPSPTWCRWRRPPRRSRRLARRCPSFRRATRRYASELGLAEAAANQLAFDAELGDYFEAAPAGRRRRAAEAVANWVTGELVARLREAGGDGRSGRLEGRARGAGEARRDAGSRRRGHLAAAPARSSRPGRPRAATRPRSPSARASRAPRRR